MFSTVPIRLQHPQRGLVGSAVQRPVERGDARGDGRVGVDLGRADGADGARRGVLFVVGVQDEEHVQRAFEPRIGLIFELGHLVHHPEEVAGVVQLVVGIDVGLAHVVPEGERGQGRHLREQPDDLGHADLLVVDLVGVRVEGRQRADRGDEHPHRVRVVAEALHEVLDVLVHEGVDRDLVDPLLQLRLRRQVPVDDQVGDLEVGRVLAQLLDRVAAVLQDPGVAVDVGDRAAAGGGVHVGGVVDHQPEVVRVGLDLSQVHPANRAVLDRQLVGGAGAVVGDRQRLRTGSVLAVGAEVALADR